MIEEKLHNIKGENKEDKLSFTCANIQDLYSAGVAGPVRQK